MQVITGKCFTTNSDLFVIWAEQNSQVKPPRLLHDDLSIPKAPKGTPARDNDLLMSEALLSTVHT